MCLLNIDQGDKIQSQAVTQDRSNTNVNSLYVDITDLYKQRSPPVWMFLVENTAVHELYPMKDKLVFRVASRLFIIGLTLRVEGGA